MIGQSKNAPQSHAPMKRRLTLNLKSFRDQIKKSQTVIPENHLPEKRIW